LPAWRQVGLGVLSQVLPGSLIDEAVAATGCAQQRVRLLPARLVVVFVLAMVVFSADSYCQVWRQVASGWSGLARLTPSRSAFTQARRRVGEAPLAWLFARVRGQRAPVGMAGVFWFGLRVVAWDGTMLQVPDSAANVAAFGRGSSGGGAAGGFPRLWLVMLVECGTRAVIDAAFGRESEVVLAGRLIGSLRPGMLLLADRNFTAYQSWMQARAQGAHLIWRVKSDRLLPVVRVLPDGSWLSRITPPARRGRIAALADATAIMVRVVEYTVTVATTDPHGQGGVRVESVRLMTSLLDPDHAPAAQLAACYAQRWEIETSYQDFKTRLRGPGAILRSHDPADVRQELWAYLTVYQALRQLITDTAAAHHVDADTLSFLTCLRVVRMKITNVAVVAGQALADAMTELIDHLLHDPVPPRRPRTSPRAVKRPHKSYRSKKPDMTSTHTTYTINVIPAGTPTSP
jgi:hypothetical protein